MRVAPVLDLDVKGHPPVLAEGPEKLGNQLCFELTRPALEWRHMADEKWPVGQVENNPGARFIHGNRGMTVAPDSCAVSESKVQGASQADPQVFHRVMAINFEVTPGLHLKIKKAVDGKKRQHVIEKRHARVKIRATLSVQAELDPDVRFPCFALHDSSS